MGLTLRLSAAAAGQKLYCKNTPVGAETVVSVDTRGLPFLRAERQRGFCVVKKVRAQMFRSPRCVRLKGQRLGDGPVEREAAGVEYIRAGICVCGQQWESDCR